MLASKFSRLMAKPLIKHAVYGAAAVVTAGSLAASTAVALAEGPASKPLALYFDHTLLKATATKSEIKQLCDEAHQYGFFSVCVQPTYVAFAKEYLKQLGATTKVCAVVGFPLGANATGIKELEALSAIHAGADEIDFVAPLYAIKNADWDAVGIEFRRLAVVCKDRNVLSKVILETCYLSPDERDKCVTLAKASGIDFVKTSTGFGTAGATVTDVAAMRKIVGPEGHVKASGGIRNLKQTQDMIAAGADRIGASAGVAILKEAAAVASGAALANVTAAPAPADHSRQY